MSASRIHFRLGTRGSLLARAQSEQVAQAVRSLNSRIDVELIEIKTTGDRITDKPLHELGGKGLFTKEIEQALLDNTIDFAVHSLKDVPVTMPLVDQSDLVIAAIPKREDASDILVSTKAKNLLGLPQGARIGTSSMRRRCQLLDVRGDLVIEMIRGNIDTRIRKLKDGEFDAIVLAMAGVRRAGLFDESLMHAIDTATVIPAAGQGALALQCRRDDTRTRDMLIKLDDPLTRVFTNLERDVVRGLNGDCHSPIAANVFMPALGEIRLAVAVGARDGGLPVMRAHARAPLAKPQTAVLSVVQELEAGGVRALLNSPAN